MGNQERKARQQWGMVIDLDRCTGCGACVTACHAENNLPLSTEKSAAMGRAVHWIRIDRYYEGEFPEVRVKHMPVLCQQCDEAPCEAVCPVYATYHNEEGLNVQVHSRCVGSRYCALNCPYSARFFNFFAPEWAEPLGLQLNPEVAVRPGGVAEKCTFCVERIKRARLKAKSEKRELSGGEAQPACVQCCPAEAMVFGDLRDQGSRVSKLARSGRSWRLLEELGTSPRVFYLKRGG